MLLVISQYGWLRYPLQIGALFLAAWIIYWFANRWLSGLALRTAATLYDQLIALLVGVLKPLVILGVADGSLNVLPLSPKLLEVINRGLYLAVLAVTLYYGSKAALLLTGHWLSRSEAHKSVQEPVKFVTRVVFGVLAVMILLENLGVSLTAAWTTLGVGSVAIALALQDTLSNFFAGFYLRIDNPIRLGDYVRLDSGDEGFVAHMSWRSTQIRTASNNIVIVPNAKLASAIVTNYSLPETQVSLDIPVRVSFESDPAQVERMLVDEASRAVGTIPGLLADPPPFVRLDPGFGESSLELTLTCRVNTFADQELVQHELRKRIWARFHREGVSMPYTQHELQIRETRKTRAAVSH